MKKCKHLPFATSNGHRIMRKKIHGKREKGGGQTSCSQKKHPLSPSHVNPSSRGGGGGAVITNNSNAGEGGVPDEKSEGWGGGKGN